MTLPLILASSSKARQSLLHQVGIVPSQIIPANIDETQYRSEMARQMAKRLSISKAELVASKIDRGVILGADTIAVVGRRIIHKATNADDVRQALQLLSHRRHQVYTGVCVIKKDGKNTRTMFKVVKSIIKFKKLTKFEIDYYCSTNEGIGKAGGYTLTGHAESFVSFLSGSFSNIIGLPLFETTNMLNSAGIFAMDRN